MLGSLKACTPRNGAGNGRRNGAEKQKETCTACIWREPEMRFKILCSADFWFCPKGHLLQNTKRMADQ